MNTLTSPEGLVDSLILVRGIQILFFVVYGMLTPHNRGQGAHLQGRRGLTLWPAFSVFFKNEHLICGELKVDNVSFQSYT